MSGTSTFAAGQIPTDEFLTHPWVIKPVVHDFLLEDLWALPVWGGSDDFPGAVDLLTTGDFAEEGPLPARVLWQIRDLLGKLFGLGRISDGPPPEASRLPIPGTTETSLVERLPSDLRGTADGLRLGSSPMVPLYRTDREFATEISNRTVHSVMHVSWAERADGHYQAQMAVYTKPRGRFGAAYMALIKPFRHLIVYPGLLGLLKKQWAAGGHDTELVGA